MTELGLGAATLEFQQTGRPDSDAVDATLAASGDASAFERLYRHHVPRIYSLIRRMLTDDDADEVTQGRHGPHTEVNLRTVNGDIGYAGPIRNGGRYSLSTHNGDITLTVAEGSNANVAVSTFNGEFESEFPVPLSGTRKGKGFNFTLGSGSAQVTLESFQGTIRLVRPGPARARDRDRDHD